MTETASLVIKVDSSGAKRATHDLDALARQGAKTEGAVSRLKSGVGALGGAFAALGGGVLVGKFLGAVIANTIEADKVQAQLAARIKSTGGAAGLALGDLNAMAKGLQNVTTYGDEAIGSAQALLLTFTNIHRDAFPKALEATLNLATAMGTDLNSAAVLVGKALNDPIQGVTALRRVGVQLTEQQQDLVKKLVETGDAAGAQKIILGELSVEMGGAARAARDTLGGALEAAKEAFGDLLEGDSGGDGVRGTKVALEDLIQTMKSPDTQAAFAQLVNGIFSVANAAVQAISKLIDFNNQLSISAGLKPNASGRTQGTVLDIGKGASKIWTGSQDYFGGMLTGDAARSKRGENLVRQGQDQGSAGLLGGDYQKSFANPGDPNSQFVPDYLKANKPPAYSFAPFNFATAGMQGVRPGGAAANDDPATGGGRGGGGGRSRLAMPDFKDEDAKALADLVAKTDEANKQFEHLAATLAGPLAEAELRHKEALQEITDVGTQAGKSSQEIADAKAAETKRYEEETAQITAQLDPARALIAEKERELKLLGLSGAARDTAIDLMRLEGKATDEQRAKLLALNEAYADTQRQIALMDDLRSAASNALTDFVTGAKSAKDALKDFFDEMAAQITKAIANKWMEQLFGSQGSTGAGTSGGGWISSIFGLLSGSGGGGDQIYANGGYTGPGAMYQPAGVVHKGEVVWSQADIAAAGGVGAVEAMRKGGRSSGGNVTNITVNVPRSFEHRAASQVAQAAAGVQARARARNG